MLGEKLNSSDSDIGVFLGYYGTLKHDCLGTASFTRVSVDQVLQIANERVLEHERWHRSYGTIPCKQSVDPVSKVYEHAKKPDSIVWVPIPQE